MALAENILECLGKFEALTVLDICCNGVTGLKAIATQLPELEFNVAPLADRIQWYVIKETKSQPHGTRMIPVADWTEFTAPPKGPDGFISARPLTREQAPYPCIATLVVGCFFAGESVMAWPDRISTPLETSC